MKIRRLTLLASAFMAALLLVGCSGGGESAERVTASEQAPAATAASPEAPSTFRYPREIPLSSMRDFRIRNAIAMGTARGRAVQLAPGIYAERGVGELGVPEDYTGVYGLCADFNQYARENEVGGTCW